jgi:hypothetical protein
MVKAKLHEKYHYIFGNKTPQEILDMLVNVFWGGNHHYLEAYYDKVKEANRKVSNG